MDFFSKSWELPLRNVSELKINHTKHHIFVAKYSFKNLVFSVYKFNSCSKDKNINSLNCLNTQTIHVIPQNSKKIT